MIDFAKFVKKLLIDKSMKQGELGDKLGMNKQEISKYLKREDYRLNADVIRIADALGLDVQLTLTDRETGQQYDVTPKRGRGAQSQI